MGADAAVFVWYGISGEPPESVMDEHYDDIDEDGEGWAVTRDGVDVTLIFTADEADPVGIGAEVFYHDWDYAPKAWGDVAEQIAAQPSPETKAAVDAVLDEVGAGGERGLWMHTRYW